MGKWDQMLFDSYMGDWNRLDMNHNDTNVNKVAKLYGLLSKLFGEAKF